MGYYIAKTKDRLYALVRTEQGTTHNAIVFQNCMRSNMIAVRGRSFGDWHNSPHEQRIELRGQKSSSLTSVAKDNLLFEMYEENQSA